MSKVVRIDFYIKFIIRCYKVTIRFTNKFKIYLLPSLFILVTFKSGITNISDKLNHPHKSIAIFGYSHFDIS